MIEQMAIPQVDRNRLLKQMEMGEQYQKSRHIGHCAANSNCISHCTVFALSDPNCKNHYSQCSQAHTSVCAEFINIVQTLDEIKQKIEKISGQDLQTELKYDF